MRGQYTRITCIVSSAKKRPSRLLTVPDATVPAIAAEPEAMSAAAAAVSQ